MGSNKECVVFASHSDNSVIKFLFALDWVTAGPECGLRNRQKRLNRETWSETRPEYKHWKLGSQPKSPAHLGARGFAFASEEPL